MPVHQVAARGFGDAAEAYEHGRPTYPPAALSWLARHLVITPRSRVCDLAAGTGKLTRLLAPLGGALVAVEPLAGMRAVLARALPSVPAVGGTAEALPLRTAVLDAVFVAQAFHWFETDASLDELARTLRPGGGLAVVWNAWDDSHGWVDRVQRVVAEAGATEQWRRGHRSRDWARRAIAEHPAFGPVTHVQFAHDQPLTVEGVVERVATTSHIVSAAPEVREGALAAVRAILATDPQTRGRTTIAFPYVTDTYTSTRA